MQFKKGSLVEVSAKKNHPSWVWRCAEVVAVNREGYSVRYYRRPGITKDSVDKVPAEVVRPCRRPVTELFSWAVGDVVEVLDGGYWKVSIMEEVFEDDYYQIRVIGSIDEFRVRTSNIRVRQELKLNQWVLLDKDSDICEDMMIRARRTSYLRQKEDSAKSTFSNKERRKLTLMLSIVTHSLSSER